MSGTTDVLIIGTGIAGLTTALKLSYAFPDRDIMLMTKSRCEESNTRYAQGGIAVVSDWSRDAYEKHMEDTCRAGDGLCDPHVVDMVVRAGPAAIEEVLRWGGSFDRDASGRLDLGREGAHSENRIVHHRDSTGREIQQTLLRQVHERPNIDILSHAYVVDLIMEGHHCRGVWYLDDQCKLQSLRALRTVLASGGAGQVYQTTTNPLIATGDGLAMAARAGADIQHMEFVQFHPTALYQPGVNPAFLISEAVRGMGAELKTHAGQPFMHKYDVRGSLASRDIVARAMYREMQSAGKPYVYLDARSLDQEQFRHKFAHIHAYCSEQGWDPAREMLPVAPAAHYMCGGVTTDLNGRTSIPGLYACGEVACTGLHGANRLASNSLLEALVFARRIFRDIRWKLVDIKKRPSGQPAPPLEVPVFSTESVQKLRKMMTNKAGVACSQDGLKEMAQLLDRMEAEAPRQSVASPEVLERYNIWKTASLIVHASQKRSENRGCFYNEELKEHA